MKLNRQSKRVSDTSPKFEISVVLYVVTLLWRPTNTRLIYSPIDKGTICGFQTLINLLWPGDAIWRHRTWSALVQIMACCPTSPSHYMKQCWLIISEVFWPSPHYDDVRMGAIASQITSLTIVYSTVYSDADQRKHQSSASLAFVWDRDRDRWIPRTKGQLRGKYFHLMTSSCWYEIENY